MIVQCIGSVKAEQLIVGSARWLGTRLWAMRISSQDTSARRYHAYLVGETQTSLHSHAHADALTRICTHTHSHMHTHAYALTRIHSHMYAHAYTRICAYTHIHARAGRPAGLTYFYECMYICLFACTSYFVNVCICAYTHMHAHAYTRIVHAS